jgi:hypothetical protein
VLSLNSHYVSLVLCVYSFIYSVCNDKFPFLRLCMIDRVMKGKGCGRKQICGLI